MRIYKMANIRWCLVIICWTMTQAYAAAQPAEIKHLEVAGNRVQTRFTLTLSQPVKPTIFSLSNPSRIVLDFPQARLSTNLNEITLKNAIVVRVRGGYPKPNSLRIVLDLNASVHYQTLIHAAGKAITIDMTARVPSVVAATPISAKRHTERAAAMALSAPPMQPFIVVIDAGHGGKDPGAVGAYGTEEKNVVLGIAKELTALMRKDPSLKPVLTRKGDYYISLGERLKCARRGKADLFIAIHADSYFNTRAHGASVYALSRHGATTVAARWLADRDNHSELGGVDLDSLKDQSYLLRSVLIDLAQTATDTDSLHLGTVLLDSLDNVTKLHYVHVEKAPFMVLKSPDIPSVLVETGFISNKKEELHLRDKRYQRTLAEAMYLGIKNYQKKYARTG